MSITLLTTVSPASPRHSSLFAGFMRDPARGLPPFLPGVDSREEYWRERIAASRSAFETAGSAGEIVDPLIDYNRRLGAGDGILGKLERVKRGEAFFVVTGQQPGALGGALMVLYKILTAVALAATIEESCSVECIPLYWCGSDDADFQEIRTFLGFNESLAPVSASFPAGAHTGAQPVGSVDLSWSESLWESAGAVLGGHPAFTAVDTLIRASHGAAADHGEAVAAILLSLFEGRIAVVDGRAGFMKRAARRLYRDYLRQEPAVKTLVGERGDALIRAGYHAQLETGSDSGIFMLEGGSRRKVPAASLPQLQAAVEDDIERCSPGVILRNLIQDHLFRPLAAVLGPAELAYRAQMLDLYPLFDIVAPAPVPRLSATLVPQPVAEAVANTGIAIDDFLDNPARLLDRLGETAVPPAVQEAGTDLARVIAGDLGEYLRRVESHLPAAPFARYRSRVNDGQRRLENALGQIREAARQAAAAAHPWARNIESVITPGGDPQERSLSLLMPFLIAGNGALEACIELGTLHIAELLEGKPGHYLFSLQPGSAENEGVS